MFSMCILTAFNILVLLAPSQSVKEMLELVEIPLSARYTLLLATVINVALSMAFEEWGTHRVSSVISWVMEWLQQRRWRTGKKAAYKLVEGGMR